MDTSTKLRVTRALQEGRAVEDVLRAEPALDRVEVEEVRSAVAALRVMAEDADGEMSAIQRAVCEGLAEIEASGIVTRTPGLMSGQPCFRGTRVPQATVDAELAAGEPLDGIMASYPTLDRADLERHARLRYPRVVVAVEDLTDDEIERIRKSEIPPEHRWDLDDLPD